MRSRNFGIYSVSIALLATGMCHAATTGTDIKKYSSKVIRQAHSTKHHQSHWHVYHIDRTQQSFNASLPISRNWLFSETASQRHGIGVRFSTGPTLHFASELLFEKNLAVTFMHRYFSNSHPGQLSTLSLQGRINWSPLAYLNLNLSAMFDVGTNQFANNSSCFSLGCEFQSGYQALGYSFQLPLVARYTSPIGLFAEFSSTYYKQAPQPSEWLRYRNTNNAVVLLDAGVGYHFPREQGVLRLEVLNMLDEEYRYYSIDTQEEKNVLPTFPADRSIVFRYTLQF